MTGGPPKSARRNTRGRERQRMHQAKITKESKMKKPWLKDQQGKARKRCQKKEALRAERSHTEKRRGAQRQTKTPNKGNTRRKQKHLAWDPNMKEQEPIAKGNPSIVIKSVRKTHLTRKGDPIPKEYKPDQQTKPSFRSSGRTQNRHSTQTSVTSSRRH